MSGLSDAATASGLPWPDMSPNTVREMRRETQKGKKPEQDSDIWEALNKAQEAQISLEAQQKAREEVWSKKLEDDLEHDLKNGAFVEYHPEETYDNFLSRMFDYSGPKAGNDDDPRLEAA